MARVVVLRNPSNPWYDNHSGHRAAALKGHRSRKRRRNPVLNPRKRRHNPDLKNYFGVSWEEALAAPASFVGVQKITDMIFPPAANYVAQPWDTQQLKEIAGNAGLTIAAGVLGSQMGASVKRAAVLGGLVKTIMQVVAQFNIEGIAQPGSLIIGAHREQPRIIQIDSPPMLNAGSMQSDRPLGATVTRV